MVIAGTPLKSLEYLLETRVSTSGLGGGSMDIDPCLEDFFLTHIVFMPTKTLVSELNKQYPLSYNTRVFFATEKLQSKPIKT